MQYLLTEEEYQAIQNDETEKLKKIKSDLQKACTLVATTSPCERHFRPDDKSPWGCVLVKGSTLYCDCCPVTNLCPSNNKRWSK